MPSTRFPRRPRNPWPGKIADWLAEDSYHPGIDPELRAALLNDRRLEEVAKKLTSLPEAYELDSGPTYPDGELHAFLQELLAIPGMWNYLSSQPKDFLAQDLVELESASARYLRVLAKHGPLVELYLAGWSDVSISSFQVGKRRFADLRESIETVRGLAGSGAHVIGPDVLAALPRKLTYKRHPQHGLRNFFVSRLAGHAMKIFGEHLYEEIALLATVCLKLDDPIGPEEVRELLRPKRTVVPKKSVNLTSKTHRVIRKKPKT